MASLEELRAERIKKLHLLEDAGMNPYTAETFRTHTIAEALDGFEMLAGDATTVTLSGRVMTLRGQGALLFFNFTDGTGVFQGLAKKGETDDTLFALFADTVDAADFIEVTGTLFRTKTEQQTILVKTWRILTKSLAPLPTTVILR